MPTPAILLLCATLLPLGAFAVLCTLGRRMGSPLAGYVGTGFISISFILSILAMISWYGGAAAGGAGWGFGKLPIVLPLRWILIGTPLHPSGVAQDNPGWLDIGIYVDSLTIIMFAMVTLVGTLVHIYSVGYMENDPGSPRFFSALAFFCFSMLGLVLGATLLHTLIFWQLLGLCSYWLIGFSFDKPNSNHAAIKACLFDQVGNLGFLIGAGILLWQLGNLTFPHLWLSLGRAGTGQSIQFSDGTVLTSGGLTAMGIALVFAAIARGAQFPLHVWLADAMEAPTPASALLHAATMLAAGVYLLARIFPILTPDAKLFIAIIGVITLTMGALIALVQTNLKKVLAFATMSQVGLMMLAIGVGSWVGGLFHLMTHAFFMSLLFLAAGSAIRVARDQPEMGGLGGLINKIPVTAITFFIGVLAIAGVGFMGIGLSGYYSKGMILSQSRAFADLAIHQGHSHNYALLGIVPVAIAYVTPFILMRCWMLTFWGKSRAEQEYDDAAERPIMWGVLIVLAILAALSGRMLSIKEMLEGSLQECNAYCRQINPNFSGFDTVWPGELPVDRGMELRGTPDVMTTSQNAQLNADAKLQNRAGLWPFAGLLAAFALYYRGPRVTKFLPRPWPIRWIRQWLCDQAYFDDLYDGVFVSTVWAAGAVLARIDRLLFNR